MKLSSKSTIYFILTTLVVFLISGISIYFMLRLILQYELDGDLTDKKLIVHKELKDVNGFENFIFPKDSSVIIGSLVSEKIEEVFIHLVYQFYDCCRSYVAYRFSIIQG